jgi:hypothetical protein
MTGDGAERRAEITRDRGVDASPDARPGVPKEILPPRPLEGTHWTEPSPQPMVVPVFKTASRKSMPPVFGTGQPPHGLSGLLRKFAYTIPEHEAMHWEMLLLADRIEARGRWLALGAAFAIALPFALRARATRRVLARAVGRPRRQSRLERLIGGLIGG